jgi:hypothetical protein
LKCADDNVGAVCVNYVKRWKSYIYKRGRGANVYNDCYELLSKKADLAPGSTIMYKRSCVENVGFYDATYKKHQDWEYLIRLFRYYSLGVIDDIEVIICPGVLGGRPNIEIVKAMKEKLFREFEQDISSLGPSKMQNIKKIQWMDIYLGYIKSRRFLNARAFRLIHNSDFSIGFSDAGRIAQAFVEGIFPKSLEYIYRIMNLKNKDLKSYRNILLN